jgi:hypothetical protein
MRKVVTLAATLAMVLAFTAPAMAEDYPCGDPYPHIGAGTFVQVCPLWRGEVPVYDDLGAGIAGYLESADGNWFVCQTRFEGAPYAVSGTDYTNDYWALTMADSGEWGWVPVAYFAGGGNYRPDAALRSCHDYWAEQGAS